MALRTRVWRPDIGDVERLSRGEAARHRGSGSRRIPHRLCLEERTLYELAKEKGYLSLRGSGYRPERKGYPLNNTWRQRSDALAKPAIVICLDLMGGTDLDTMVVDLATLRLGEESDGLQRKKQEIIDLAEEHEVQLVNESMGLNEQRSLLPFNFIPLHDDVQSVDQSGPTRSRSKTNGRKTVKEVYKSGEMDSETDEEVGEGIQSSLAMDPPLSNSGITQDELSSLMERLTLLVDEQKERVRWKKLHVSSLQAEADPVEINNHPDVKIEVRVLLDLKKELEKAKETYGSLRDQIEAQERRRSSSQSIQSLYNLFETSDQSSVHDKVNERMEEEEEEEEEVKGKPTGLTYMAATWQLEPVPLLFKGDGSKLKKLARSIVQAAAEEEKKSR